MVVKVVEFPVERSSSLMRFLSQLGVLNTRYLAFSMPLNGTENPSELERRLAGIGKVNCDVLGTGELIHNGEESHCKVKSFLAGKSAIVVYDRQRLEEVSNGYNALRRPGQGNPSEYVAMVIVPKVREAVVG